MDCDTSYSVLASTTFQFWKTVKMQTSLTQITIYYTFITYITLDLAAIEGKIKGNSWAPNTFGHGSTLYTQDE